jgi:hypothetical protein
MKKSTAVETMAFLLELEIGDLIPDQKLERIHKIIGHAKAMEKKQIMEAYMKAKLENVDTLGLNSVKNKIIKFTEQYYNETYGGEK